MYPIQEAKPSRSDDPYAHTALNPDFVPTRSDLMGKTFDQSPGQPGYKSSLPMNYGASPAQVAADSQNAGVGQGIGDPDGEGLSISLAAAMKVRNGLTDLRSKLNQMKQQKEKAEREMLLELDEYNKRKLKE